MSHHIKECDHWHDDAGMMTHHMAFTLEMEQAIQSVDPTVCIPYWDYTWDRYLIDNSTIKDFTYSQLFGYCMSEQEFPARIRGKSLKLETQ